MNSSWPPPIVPKIAVGETSIHAPFSRGVEPFASVTSTSAAERRRVEEFPQAFGGSAHLFAASALSLSTAISTRSGVAGASRRGQILWSATLATASDSACSTDMPSGKAARRPPWSDAPSARGFRPVGELHVEDFRAVRGERDLVGRRRMRAQPALGVPPQFFRRQPAHALDEAAFDLAEIDGRGSANGRSRAVCRCVRPRIRRSACRSILPSRTRHRRNSRTDGPRPCRGSSGFSASCRSPRPKAGCAPYRPA